MNSSVLLLLWLHFFRGYAKEPNTRAEEFDVAVIGSGAAGITAAAELAREGYDVVVLEAANRTGGRMYTGKPFGTGVPLDLGAFHITSGTKNPLHKLAKKWRKDLAYVNWDGFLYFKDDVKMEGSAVTNFFNLWYKMQSQM
eukprot:gnl/MRDRNA2_/MRDRNA2_220670_c0_seq1.p1 gnl/MRDRNA2_/MRDRNA2_220670_c0~~gnl/MRDRNA2_/MRDRNA2_220670_c0_seq1.p1  ORF type:complete len:141 (-),score=27.34 gnl/MRDRNA2_/MRDRNA2_220670_c0_seq1:149-571(-)